MVVGPHLYQSLEAHLLDRRPLEMGPPVEGGGFLETIGGELGAFGSFARRA